MTTAELKPDGVHTVCRDCSRPLILPASNEVGEPIDIMAMSEKSRRIAMNFATMIVCDDCSEKAEAERERQHDHGAWQHRMSEAQIPKAFRELSFEQMIRSGKRAAAVDRLEQWASHPDPGGVMLWGAVGAGKTRLAGTAAVARCRRFPLRWVSVAVLFAQLSAAFSDDERKMALRVLTGKGGLVLDDLDKVSLSEHSRGRLLVAIDNRINHGSPLLVTANLSPQGLANQFGAAIVSRLAGYCQAFEMDGPDRRTSMAAA